jgi:hypothetical protein
MALALLLASCGQAAEVATVSPTTTKAPFAPVSGESNGVRWRTLDLEDEANAEVKEELLRRQDKDQQTEFPMGGKKIIYGTYGNEHDKIEMVDEAGKRTVLLETDKVEATDEMNERPPEMSWRYPKFNAILDDRYFLYVWMGWSWGINMGIYDTKEMKEITIIDYVLNTVKVQGNYIYYVDAVSEEEYNGEPHLYAYDWTAIKRGEPVKGVDLLAGFNGPDACFGDRLLTDDLRYYLATEGRYVDEVCWEDSVRIYDLANKKLLTTLTEPDFPIDKLEEWNGKIYWVKYSDADCALEITLP